MGQYFAVINYDKKVKYDPIKVTPAVKWESFVRSCVNSIALIDLLTYDWCGDRVAVIGDYSDIDDYCDKSYNNMSGFDAKSIIERNIDLQFVHNMENYYVLDDMDCELLPQYTGFDNTRRYMFVNFNKEAYLRFDAFAWQDDTYKDLINVAHSTGAFYAMCHLIRNVKDVDNPALSWKGDHVGIVEKKNEIIDGMVDVSDLVLNQNSLASFDEYRKGWGIMHDQD